MANRIHLAMMIGVMTSGLPATVPPAAAAPPIRIIFEKSRLDATVFEWNATVVSADGEHGTIRTSLQSAKVQPKTAHLIHIKFLFELTFGSDEIKIDLAGFLNTNTGRVVMNGRVNDNTHGPRGDTLRGAQVHEVGQAQDNRGLRSSEKSRFFR
jgi:hypothetical protein